MVEMEVLGVQVELPFNTPVILLREIGDEARVLPIVVDVPEAQAIGRILEGVRMPRPMTHDLMTDILDQLDVELISVTVTELRDRTFFAELVVEGNGLRRTISARPSDSVALAVRAGTPIFVADEVLAMAATRLEVGDLNEYDDEDFSNVGDEESDPSELLDEFKLFLDDINPEDFQS
ncbi:MAG: bifunctional nuclease family protein [Actinomycetia bacterium]|nr:bifunctional nuclease family protein [Actinomycetes bacterium]MCP4962674.1 bifunctional nuclease family protein [Actinomycetes bacterium]